MKAFALDGFGAPGSVRDVPDPEPAEGQVLVRVAAVGLNPWDSAVIGGAAKEQMEHRFPLIPGSDASGSIEAVGAGVSEWSVGDDVFGSMGKSYLGEGSLAELAAMSAGTVARKPASIEHVSAAAVPVAGVTAKVMVDAADVSAGQVVVVVGATGGVGSYLVQLATRLGGRVVAVASGNADYARSLGAADVIDYETEDVVETVRSRYPDGIDVVADLQRDAERTARLAEALRAGGHVVSATGTADVEMLGARAIEAANVFGKVTTEQLRSLADLLEAGEIEDPEILTLPLSDANDAFERVGSGHVRGKIVVTVG